MKRIISCVLAVVILCSMIIPVFAESEEKEFDAAMVKYIESDGWSWTDTGLQRAMFVVTILGDLWVDKNSEIVKKYTPGIYDAYIYSWGEKYKLSSEGSGITVIIPAEESYLLINYILSTGKATFTEYDEALTDTRIDFDKYLADELWMLDKDNINKAVDSMNDAYSSAKPKNK